MSHYNICMFSRLMQFNTGWSSGRWKRYRYFSYTHVLMQSSTLRLVLL